MIIIYFNLFNNEFRSYLFYYFQILIIFINKLFLFQTLYSPILKMNSNSKLNLECLIRKFI